MSPEGRDQGPGVSKEELLAVLERLVEDCQDYTSGTGCVGCAGEPERDEETNEEEIVHEDCTIMRAKELIRRAKETPPSPPPSPAGGRGGGTPELRNVDKAGCFFFRGKTYQIKNLFDCQVWVYEGPPGESETLTILGPEGNHYQAEVCKPYSH